MKRVWIIFLCAISSFAGFGQNKQGNIWYFGRNAGLDFNTEPPTILTDGQLNTWEGCATLADTDGNLLFYTDGIRAWDRAHNQMPNGNGLGGNPSATQSGVIVPYPGNSDLYYLFSVDFQVGELQYALVDLTANGGMGDVVDKNNVLINSATEKITAVQHANGQDFWVVGHEWNSNRFFTWRISDGGLDTNPVISAAGSEHKGSSTNSIGYMKFSSAGNQLALASYWNGNFVEILDFDLETGVITNPTKISDFGASGPYGIEFSPSGQFLYISEAQGSRAKVYQVKLPTTDGDIADRGIVLAEGVNFSGLQIAPNGKIYHTQDGHLELNVIHEPDLEGVLANYEEDAQYLGGRRAANGLPTFIQSFFKSVDFSAAALCEGDQTAFTIESEQLADIDSVVWDFGDAGSADNQSELMSPEHVFSSAGNFLVKLTAYIGDRATVATKNITINALPTVDLGADQVLIGTEAFSITLPGTDSHQWQDGNTDDSRQFSSAGWYWVDATSSEGCTVRDSLALFALSYADTCFTSPTRFVIDTGNITPDSLRWNFGDANAQNNTSTLSNTTHEFTEPGDFTFETTIYYNGNVLNKSHRLTINPLPDANLATNALILNGAPAAAGVPADLSVSWQDGLTDQTRSLDQPGWYWADVTNNNQCTTRDSLAVFRIDYADTCFTSSTRFAFNSGNIAVDSVRWSFGDGSPPMLMTTSNEVINEFSATGAFEVTATIYHNDRDSEVKFPLNISELPAPELGPDRTLFYGETLMLDASGTGSSYQWQDGSSAENFLVASPDTYWVEVTNAAGCLARDSVIIDYDQLIDVALPADTVLCIGETLPLDMSLPDASYRWQDGSTNATFTVEAPGTYWVEITNAYANRTKVDSITVDYYQFGNIEVQTPVVICEEGSTVLNATGAAQGESYRWYNENMDFLEENSGSYTTPTLSTSSDYFVTLTNGRCESDPIRLSIIFDQVFAETLPADSIIIDVGESVMLQGFGGETYEWSPPQWLDSSTSQIVNATPDDDIEYTLTVTSALGCSDDTRVWVLLEKAIDIPNAFTPNNDGFNDYWKVKNIERYPDNNILLFDREGNLIHELKSYKNDWNGEINGKALPMGTYFYIIDLADGSKEIRGAISILK